MCDSKWWGGVCSTQPSHLMGLNPTQWAFNKTQIYSVQSVGIKVLNASLFSGKRTRNVPQVFTIEETFSKSGKKKYLSDIKVSFQVVSHYAVEFICGVERSFCRLCGDLQKCIYIFTTHNMEWAECKGLNPTPPPTSPPKNERDHCCWADLDIFPVVEASHCFPC